MSQCADMNFILTVDEGEDTIEVVYVLKYLGRPLDRPEDNWPVVIRNIQKAIQIWDGWEKS